MSENVFEDRGLQSYLNEIAQVDPLTREEEEKLAVKAQKGDKEAINKILTANLKFVVRVAARYQNRGLTLSELISEGNQGLIKAIEKFEPERHNKFISYAVWWIKQRIISALTEKNNLIRMPLDKVNLLNKINKQKERTYSITGSRPDEQEISEDTNVPLKHIKKVKMQEINTVSIHDKSHSSHQGQIDFDNFLRDVSIADPKELYLAKRRDKKIERALNELPARDSFIIREYFGLEGKKGKNFAQIAEELGLSRERVRQIQKKALERVSETLDFDYEDEFIYNTNSTNTP
ncbi:MAG: RNA polymerase sigma factor RpoD/SigA [Candidatus Stygibacter australis]|nr:RNA polymerase sigma factor RpoD/SigA [Candidatus Stygibacter australis]MDP8321010.1 RNA polymerase sigma factor RpoD/SigA [Candidatus Stygibacter australis]